jgi:hypothetical protein
VLTVFGSSMSSSASEQFAAPPAQVTSRLVTLVARLTVMFAVGTVAPTDSGLPPMQVSTISPMSSVMPSLRSWFGTATLAVHVNGPAGVLLGGPTTTCADASPTDRANIAIARIVLRKFISFSL